MGLYANQFRSYGKRCDKCRPYVNEDGETHALHIKWISHVAYDWYNLGLRRMGGLAVGPCRGCHNLKSTAVLQLFHVLSELGILKEFDFETKTKT